MQQTSRNGLVTGAILISLGLLFLVTQLLDISLWEFTWPLIIIAVGGAFFFGMLTGGRESAGLAVPGSVISTIGLILLLMNLFGHWQAWSYAWALIVAAVGVGRYIQGQLLGDANLQRDGWRTLTVGALLFVFFGAFFELVIGISGYGGLGGYVWPLLLIGLGLYLIFRRVGGRPTRVMDAPLPAWNEPIETVPAAPAARPTQTQTPLPAASDSKPYAVEMAPPASTAGVTCPVETALTVANSSARGGQL